ncbi:TIR domain-containing protein [Pseudomonas sp. GL-RE-29]|uniref:TIR domain-containing protein n=1 Tax=Pseudomonas sp. GL-RE-29 TaxID=2832375 RepID=UPI001CBC7806|nr:TIR domain-containing protein [Pseudomonas sp. GL-RE-29]
MPKPRVFIGSSVEGLSVAYPVQQNLLHEAEVTIWDQGVFELSQTTMESLTKILSESDFAIFVFSPDDLVQIRDLTAPAVRDNVLFEFGLFVGKLGRERVFFVLPSDGDLHIPTDLLGVTPGRYESTREDGSMQAATGSVCYQIRLQMKKLGIAPGRIAVEENTEGGIAEDSESRDWLLNFIDEKYDEAKATLQNELESLSGETALSRKAWILYCDFKLRNDGNIDALINYAKEHFELSGVQSIVAAFLRMEGYVTNAIELLTSVQEKRPKDTEIAMALALCHSDGTDIASAIAELQRVGPDEFPEVAIRLAETLEREENTSEALSVVMRCYAKHPSHKELRFKYARLAQELGKDNIAAYLLDRLTHDNPNSIEYWGYLGNSCLQLDLFDKALYSYRRAEKLMNAEYSSQWITANIGNLFINKDLPSEACEYLDRAVKLESDSEYAHERLASALRKKTSEAKEFQRKCAEGKRQVREAITKVLNPSTTEPNAPLGLLSTTLLTNLRSSE